ncbi:60S acidic ribosomal protein P1 [Penicillium cf. griseofulvum]|uniref:Large ribosomal subunit protein P1 n=1 Tax=Penicillium cf. griseofulvum TaxID=2972120 RepID=A0A9W9M0L5_9EURO|nr:60S acidic ribosomal protein P1 [Penicillium cf. griseofulvum]KAJ5430427.1 60S acidic ribosomal protein P1 [Penicillium cf. griseofulvum]KAJ5435803.1 60S acidic ribosomal protein P1 [Penicillium cf. griseofulvum]
MSSGSISVYGLARSHEEGKRLSPISPSPKRGLFPTHGAFALFGCLSLAFSSLLLSHPQLSSRHPVRSTPPVDMSTAELACSYAALILADDGLEVSADKIQTLITAAKVQEVEPIWASIFARALEGKDIKDLLTNVGSAGPAAAGPAAAGGAAAAAPAEAKAEEKEEDKEESDEDMGFGLFD